MALFVILSLIFAGLIVWISYKGQAKWPVISLLVLAALASAALAFIPLRSIKLSGKGLEILPVEYRPPVVREISARIDVLHPSLKSQDVRLLFVPEDYEATLQDDQSWEVSLPDGKYTVVVLDTTSKEGFALADLKVKDPSGTFSLDRFPKAGDVAGSIRDVGGNPVAGVLAKLDGGKVGVTGAGGRFTIARVPDGSYTLEAVSGERSSKPSKVTSSSSDVNIIFPDPVDTFDICADLQVKVKEGGHKTYPRAECDEKEYPAGTTKLFAFTRIIGSQGNTEIKHVWIREGSPPVEVVLPIGADDFRTFSEKQVGPGNWTVEVRAHDGQLLEKQSFSVAIR